MALNKLYLTFLCKLETTYPEAAFIVAGDFNKANLKTRLPKLYRHIDCATMAGKTLDHCLYVECVSLHCPRCSISCIFICFLILIRLLASVT